MTQTKILLSTDVESKTAVVQQGLVEIAVVLDPWPATDAEIEAQAFAAVAEVNDDFSKLAVPAGIHKEVVEL